MFWTEICLKFLNFDFDQHKRYFSSINTIARSLSKIFIWFEQKSIFRTFKPMTLYGKNSSIPAKYLFLFKFLE